MDTAVIEHAGPADLIAYAWYELGYRPSDSLVLIALHDPRLRAGAIARSDLLPAPHPKRSLLAEHVRMAAAPLAASGATSVIALICCDDALQRPRPPLVRVLVRELPRLGLTVRDVVGVAESAYRSLLCDDAECCPPQGHPLTEALSSATAAMEVVTGRWLAASEADLIADVQPDEAELDDEPDGIAQDGDEPAEQRWQWWCWWRDEVARQRGSGPEPDPRIKIFWWVLADIALRDAVVLHAMGAPDEQCEALLRPGSVSTASDQWDACLAAAEQPPDETALRVIRDLLALSARHARPGCRAPVLTVLAWLAWFEGNGVRSRLLVRQALDDDARYTLALLVDQILSCGVAPSWAHHPPHRPAPDG